MCESLLKGHLQICLCRLPTGPIDVAVGKSVGGVIAYYRLPLALYHDLKLHREPCHPSSGNPAVNTRSCVGIQLALILDIPQCSSLLLRNGGTIDVFYSLTSFLPNRVGKNKEDRPYFPSPTNTNGAKK